MSGALRTIDMARATQERVVSGTNGRRSLCRAERPVRRSGE